MEDDLSKTTQDTDLDEQPSGEPLDVDEDWRKAELEKLMFGEEKKKSPLGKALAFVAFLVVVGWLGWSMFGGSSDPAEATSRPRAAIPAAQAQPEPPPRPMPPPPPPPPPKPYKDLFEIQTQFDQSYIVYTIQPDDTLFKIGEKLHDVTGVPRMITHQAVEDAYWRKYFSYDQQNVNITSDEEVAKRVGEIIQIPVPLQEYPGFDLATKVQEYNAS